jgi:hypothetical protein
MADNCPKCGAERGTGLSAGAFTCGSYIQANRKVYQCKTCRIAELEAEVERLEEGINDAMDYQTTAVIFATLREALEEES